MSEADAIATAIVSTVALLWSYAFVWDRARRRGIAEGQRFAAMRLLAAFNLVRSEDYNPERPPTVDEAIDRAKCALPLDTL